MVSTFKHFVEQQLEPVMEQYDTHLSGVVRDMGYEVIRSNVTPLGFSHNYRWVIILDDKQIGAVARDYVAADRQFILEHIDLDTEYRGKGIAARLYHSDRAFVQANDNIDSVYGQLNENTGPRFADVWGDKEIWFRPLSNDQPDPNSEYFKWDESFPDKYGWDGEYVVRLK